MPEVSEAARKAAEEILKNIDRLCGLKTVCSTCCIHCGKRCLSDIAAIIDRRMREAADNDYILAQVARTAYRQWKEAADCGKVIVGASSMVAIAALIETEEAALCH